MKLRLGPLPNTEVLKLTITIPLELKHLLERYAEVHAATYGQPTPMPALIVQMLTQFIARDRSFQRALRAAKSSLPSRPG